MCVMNDIYVLFRVPSLVERGGLGICECFGDEAISSLGFSSIGWGRYLNG